METLDKQLTHKRKQLSKPRKVLGKTCRLSRDSFVYCRQPKWLLFSHDPVALVFPWQLLDSDDGTHSEDFDVPPSRIRPKLSDQEFDDTEDVWI